MRRASGGSFVTNRMGCLITIKLKLGRRSGSVQKDLWYHWESSKCVQLFQPLNHLIASTNCRTRRWVGDYRRQPDSQISWNQELIWSLPKIYPRRVRRNTLRVKIRVKYGQRYQINRLPPDIIPENNRQCRDPIPTIHASILTWQDQSCMLNI